MHEVKRIRNGRHWKRLLIQVRTPLHTTENFGALTLVSAESAAAEPDAS